MSQPLDKIKFRKGVFLAVAIVFVLFVFAVTKGFYSDGLQHLGIRPRTLHGVIGIFTAPIVHGDLYHLLSNTFPLLFAIPLLFYFFYKRAFIVLTSIYLLSGFWVWISARDAVHLGASGVVYGLMSFLFFGSLLKRERSGLALAAVIIFLYGAPLVIGFFPTPGISFEAHISGALSGFFMAVFLNYYDKGDTQNGKDEKSIYVSSTADKKIKFKYLYKSSSDPEKK